MTNKTNLPILQTQSGAIAAELVLVFCVLVTIAIPAVHFLGIKLDRLFAQVEAAVSQKPGAGRIDPATVILEDEDEHEDEDEIYDDKKGDILPIDKVDGTPDTGPVGP